MWWWWTQIAWVVWQFNQWGKKTLCANSLCKVIILAFTVTFLKDWLKSQRVQYVLNRTQSCHSFSNSLYLCIPIREILFSYPRELNLFPIIVQDGYLFSEYKSGVLGDECTKGPSWWLWRFIHCSVASSHYIPSSFHTAHRSLGEITQ